MITSVFSNKAASLLSFVEDYEQKNLLKNNAGFKDAYSVYEIKFHNLLVYRYAQVLLTIETYDESCYME